MLSESYQPAVLGYMRVDAVAKVTGLGKSTVWQWAKEGKLPKPIKLAARITVWKIADINAWLTTDSQKEQA